VTSDIVVWAIALGVIAGVLFRPRNWPEAVWACAGAALLLVLRALSPIEAARAAAKGADVYLFLTGMMALAELARHEGVFDWIAGHAVTAARGSRSRLFALVYGAGILVTVFLSNDATAVVLTPAVYAAVRRARAAPLPYLYACAFIANAASFVLPISNPANLVVYGSKLPALGPWLRMFALPSVCAIAATFAALRWLSRNELKGSCDERVPLAPLTSSGRRAAWGIAGAAIVLVASSALGRDLGLPTCLAAAAALLIAAPKSSGRILRGVSWSVLPLVAGLFILVAALDRTSLLPLLARALNTARSEVAVAFGAAALSNAMNNLPAGLLLASALRSAEHLRQAVLIGVDLGPNLSVTGSLATVLWLIALRREGENVTGLAFLKVGAIVMPPALLLAVLAL
jgi:arsenical pump membrane protein